MLYISGFNFALALVLQAWCAGLVVFTLRHVPTSAIEVHQPSGHVSHESLWSKLNDDRPVQGGIVDTYIMESISFHPRVALLHDFLTPDECRQLIALAKQGTVHQKLVARGPDIVTLPASLDPLVLSVEERLARTVLLPYSNAEPLRVFHYQAGQLLDEHVDTLTPQDGDSQQPGGQRVVTVAMYLNDVEVGGETRFSEFEVQPRAGDALLWYNCHPNGEPDLSTAHSSAPLPRGDKWVAVQYYRASKHRVND